MLILGLDVSTSCTGWAVMDEHERIIEHGAVDLSKNKEANLLDKARSLRYSLQELKARHAITNVVIEDYLEKIRKGKGSAHTTCLLAGFNTTTQYICSEIFGFDPLMIKFSVARKKLDINPIKDEKIKITAYKKIIEEHKEFVIKINKLGNVDKKNYDSSDAVVMAKYYCRMKNEGKTINSSKKIRRAKKSR